MVRLPNKHRRRLLLLTGICAISGCQAAVPVPSSPPPLATVDAADSAAPVSDTPASTPPVQAAPRSIQQTNFAAPVVATAEPIGSVPENVSVGEMVRLGLVTAPTLFSDDVPGDVADGTTLEQLEGMVITSHPAIAEARARIDAARGRYVQAGLPFNPVLMYQSEEIGNEDASGLHSVSLSQQIVTANKLGIARGVQSQEVQKQIAQTRLVELKILTQVRTEFAKALVAQQRLALAEKIVKLAEQSVASVQTLVDAQEVSRIALLQARVEAEQAQIAVENAATQLQASRRALAAAVGIRALPDDRLVGDVSDGLTESPWQLLLDEIVAASPEMAQAGSELERARWALQLACAQVVPNVTAQAGVGVDGASNDTFATVGISVPLPIRNRNEGNIRAARAEVAAAAAAIERNRLDLETRLANAVGRYRMALQRYRRLNEQVLPDAEETFELSRTAFEAGESSYLQLLTTQRTLFDTRLSVIGALGEAREALAQIEGLLVNLD